MINKKLEKLLSGVFLSSVASLVSNDATADKQPFFAMKNIEEQFVEKLKLTPKLVLKLNRSGDWNLVNHRSHRSHSSHRSHYSSSGGSSTYTPSRSSGSNSSSNSNGSGNSPSTTTPIKPTPKNGDKLSTTPPKSTTAELGHRTLSKGMTGMDVTELANILLVKKYLFLPDGKTNVDGELIFNDVIEEAVKNFQKDNELTANGIVDPATTFLLKKK